MGVNQKAAATHHCYVYNPGFAKLLYFLNSLEAVMTVKHNEAYKTQRAKKAKVGQLTYKLVLCRL